MKKSLALTAFFVLSLPTIGPYLIHCQFIAAYNGPLFVNVMNSILYTAYYMHNLRAQKQLRRFQLYPSYRQLQHWSKRHRNNTRENMQGTEVSGFPFYLGMRALFVADGGSQKHLEYFRRHFFAVLEVPNC